MFTNTFHKRRRVAWLFILPLFLAWINSALGLPLISMVMKSSHNIHLTYEHGEIHLKLDHHENQDNHDMPVNDFHSHDHALSPTDHLSFTSEQRSGSDHEFHISSLFQQNIATVKINKIIEISTPFAAIDRLMPKYFDHASIKHFPQSFSENKSTLFSLRKVILLI